MNLSGINHDLLLQTKLQPPVCRDHVKRPYLLRLLEDAMDRNEQLVLLSAAAGYGKTSLVTQWLASTNRRAAWVSLDNDDDPVRFWTVALKALKSTYPDWSPQLPPALESDFGRMSNAEQAYAFASAPHPVMLILDNYQSIHASILHTQVIYLVQHTANLHLVVISRIEPPWALGKLRAMGKMLDLRDEDLRFTHDEIISLLNLEGLETLQADAVDILESRTEGWITGLRLAVLALRSQPEPYQFLRSFSGSHRYILEYLMDEVLAHGTNDDLVFLMKTAILRRLNSNLCDAVLETSDSGQRLARLHQANMFITALDEQSDWYCYHSLFAEFMYDRLVKQSPEQVKPLHQRASAWYEANQLPYDAMHHAVQASDYQTVERLILLYWPTIAYRGELETAFCWLKAVPAPLLAASPQLNIYLAWTLFLEGKFGDVLPYTIVADDILHSLPLPPNDYNLMQAQIAALRAYLARVIDHDFDSALRYSGEALHLAPHSDRVLRAIIGINHGHILRERHELNRAADAFEEAINILIPTGNWVAVGHALLQLVELRDANTAGYRLNCLCQSILGQAETDGTAQRSAMGLIHIALAHLLLRMNDTNDIQKHLKLGLTLCELGGHLEGLRRGKLIEVTLYVQKQDCSMAQAAAQQAIEIAQTIGSEMIVQRTTSQVNALLNRTINHISRVEHLTNRELEILRLLSLGLSNQEIADHLSIAMQTVKKHTSNIYGKLHASSRTHALARARELGLL